MEKNIYELIANVATNLPADVVESLLAAKLRAKKNSREEFTLAAILKNISLAKSKNSPICQDTGTLTFFVSAPADRETEIRDAIAKAVDRATADGLLRPNSVEPISGKPLGNLAEIEFENSEKSDVEIQLLAKGGGSENVSQQVSLASDRNFDGVKKAVLKIVREADGRGCPPGIASVIVGGDRTHAWQLAKKNLLRKIGKQNSDEKLAELEAEILAAANETKIGAGGTGGKSTLLDCRVAALPRHPACFFVTVAYSCHALRHGKIVLDSDGEEKENDFNSEILSAEIDFSNAKKITLPLDEATARSLKIGEVVLISGRAATGRDRVFEFARENSLPQNLENLAIFHAGPVAKKIDGEWKFVAAGPTTSARMNSATPDFLAKTGVRAIVGKGGMNAEVSEALQKNGAVYFAAIGGAATLAAERVSKVHAVDFLDEFGMTDAMWSFEFDEFPAIVGMDASGGNLFENLG